MGCSQDGIPIGKVTRLHNLWMEDGRGQESLYQEFDLLWEFKLFPQVRRKICEFHDHCSGTGCKSVIRQ